MEKKKERRNFGEEEKSKIRELVMERRDIVENKKSDMMSLLEKKKAWAEITEEFNSSGDHPERTTAQLKKLWENIKARRKMLLNDERQTRSKTDGGLATEIPDDPELDGMGVEVKLEEVMDSDTASLEPGGSLVVLPVDPLQQEGMYAEIGSEDDPAEDELSNFPRPSPVLKEREPQTPAADMQRRGPVRVHEEEAARVQRNQQFLQQSKEMHEKKLEEQTKKIQLLDLQIELAKKQNEHEKNMELRAAQIHELNMKKCQLEVELLEASRK
uniref:Regulatory protein zeste n=1 Tax=Lygus hesperus TaxID=30085 RepID=A0A0A9YS34_LYGHE